MELINKSNKRNNGAIKKMIIVSTFCNLCLIYDIIKVIIIEMLVNIFLNEK